MKKILASLFVLLVLFVSAFAQSVPQTMSYQAVVRDANGHLYANKTVSVTISILKNNALGDAVYTESQNVPTNANGLMSLEFGNDADFSTIDWANGPYFIKTETNVNGTIIEATSQLLSVPYAKYAETAGNVPNMDEYVKKSELNWYVDSCAFAAVHYVFMKAVENSFKPDTDTLSVFVETIKNLSSMGSSSEKSYSSQEKTSVNIQKDEEPVKAELMRYEDVEKYGVSISDYRYLTTERQPGLGLLHDNYWETGEVNSGWASFLYQFSYVSFAAQHKNDGVLEQIMKDNFESDYEYWESTSDKKLGKETTTGIVVDLLEGNYEKWKSIAAERLGDSAVVDSLLKEWTSEDYAKWDETAREELGDEVVDAILEALLDEEGGWEKYVEYAKTDNDGAVYKKITNIGVNSDGSTNGVFSVSDTKTIRFSKGNLQYQGSSNTWRFAECQFDAVAGKSNNHVGENGGNVYVNNMLCDNINVSSSYSGWIDLFAWGTSGKMVANGDSTYTAYLPYSISGDASDYYYGKSLAGTVADWGVNMGSQWRTLTTEEWDYLYQGRAGAADKIAYATITTKKNVNGSDVSIEVPGIVLLPDNWVGNPAKCKPFSASLSFSANQYTEEQWYAMQATGAVFLPASGVRKISDKSNLTNHVWLTSTKTYAAYWTADANKNGSAMAYWFVGSDDKLIQQQSYTKTAGMCVRLVTDNN